MHILVVEQRNKAILSKCFSSYYIPMLLYTNWFLESLPFSMTGNFPVGELRAEQDFQLQSSSCCIDLENMFLAQMKK